MGAGWRSLQTLNTGNLPTTLQQLSGAVTRQWGIRVFKVVWKNPGASASFSIVDPKDSTILLDDTTPGSYAGPSPFYDFGEHPATWRDFQVTISAGTLEIWYRA